MPTAWGCDGQRHRDRDGMVTGTAEQSTGIAGSWHSQHKPGHTLGQVPPRGQLLLISSW